MNRALQPLGVAVVLAAVGCGPIRPPLGTVEGTVTYNGRPLAAGQILFEVAGARPAQGRIVDGRIVEVTCYAPGDGAPVGPARIAIFATERGVPAEAGTMPATPQEAWAAGGLAAPGGRSLIPSRYNDLETSGLRHDLVRGSNELTLALHD